MVAEILLNAKSFCVKKQMLTLTLRQTTTWPCQYNFPKTVKLKILPFGKGMKECMQIYTWSESNADTVRTGVPMEYSSETVLTYGALIHDGMPGFRFTVMATSAVS